ncbi:MAG TPA: TIGR03016 family PEP-CTERM system-associated outer membrane protein [Gammaproteobacteria bacterium]|nr:TIGR03016 family PEP-CTERM system-associated outer membrane protein [Gammaproteobacteria bacterium]
MSFAAVLARGCTAAALVGFGLLIPGDSAWGASWRVDPYVELSETYTNNITLRSGGQKEGEFVTQINPGLAVTADGRNLDLLFFYRLQNLFYLNVPGRNNSYQQLLGRFDSSLVRNFLFLDGEAAYRQMVIDPEDDIGQGNISIVGGRQNLATTRLSPYIRKKLGRWSLVELRYGYDAMNFLGGSAYSSLSRTFSGRLVDATPADRWRWAIGFSSRNVDYVSGGGTLGQAPSEEMWRYIDYALDYGFNRKLVLNGKIGYEDNKFLGQSGSLEPQGVYWNLGVTWQPTPRSAFVIGRGQRYFGPNWNLDLSRKGRRSLLGLSYVHDVTTRRRSLLEIPLFDSDGNPIVDPDTSEQVTGRVPVQGVYIRQRAQMWAEYGTRKSRFLLSYYRELSDYQSQDRKEEVSGGSLGWRTRLSRRTTFLLTMRGEDTDAIGRYRDRLRISKASLKHDLSRKTQASVDLRRTRRERSRSADYVETLLTARIVVRW